MTADWEAHREAAGSLTCTLGNTHTTEETSMVEVEFRRVKPQGSVYGRFHCSALLNGCVRMAEDGEDGRERLGLVLGDRLSLRRRAASAAEVYLLRRMLNVLNWYGV